VIEEINMNDDDPGDVAFENFSTAAFSDHPLEAPVLGTRDSIRGMTRDDIMGYWDRRYGTESLVIAAVGNLEHNDIVGLVEERFGEWDGGNVDHTFQETQPSSRVELTRRDTEQAHILIGGKGLKRDDERRFSYQVLNHIMGSGMSSRLFREVREERGLAYSIYAFRLAYADAGAWGVYVGTTPSQTDTALKVIRDELDKVMEEGVTDDELDRAKGSMRGGLALSLEDSNSRMIRLGRDELAGMPHLSTDERLERLDAVTRDDVQQVAREMYSAERLIGAVGPFDPSDLEPYLTS
jgi:predicted Zn-dependent peptidase